MLAMIRRSLFVFILSLTTLVDLRGGGVLMHSVTVGARMLDISGQTQRRKENKMWTF